MWLINCFFLWSGLAPGRRCEPAIAYGYHTTQSTRRWCRCRCRRRRRRWRWGFVAVVGCGLALPVRLGVEFKKRKTKRRSAATLVLANGPGPAGVIGAITATGSFFPQGQLGKSTALRPRIKVNHCSGKLVYCSSCQPKTPGDADPTGAEGERRGGCRCVGHW